MQWSLEHNKQDREDGKFLSFSSFGEYSHFDLHFTTHSPCTRTRIGHFNNVIETKVHKQLEIADDKNLSDDDNTFIKEDIKRVGWWGVKWVWGKMGHFGTLYLKSMI